MPPSTFTPDAPERVFSGRAQAALWFSLGVGLLVMQMGAYLVPGLGLRDAVWAIGLGSGLGAAILAWTAYWGARSGLSSAGLMQQVFGMRLARLPVALNVLQLVGWTCFELVIMREGTQAIAQQALGWTPAPVWITLFWGLLLTLLMRASMLQLVRRFVSRAGVPLVVLSLLWLTWQFAEQAAQIGGSSLWQRVPQDAMGFGAALDLVIAMPISWLPLVADYSRHGQRPSTSFWGTWLGFCLANVWCYGLGVLMASVTDPGTNLLAAMLLAQGGLLALALILLDELDNSYGDAYSAAVSLSSWRVLGASKGLATGVAIVCTLLALVLPMHQLEPFLLLLSSVFVPLYGVMLGRLTRRPELARTGAACVARLPFGLWALGVVGFHVLAHWLPAWGASLPTLLLTGVLSWALSPAPRSHAQLG